MPEAQHRLRLGVLASHPIQYQSPIFRELAGRCELQVFYAHRQSPRGQADAGFGVAFEWDVDLLSGFPHRFLANRARQPGTDRFLGCDTPEIAAAIASGGFDAFLVMGWNLKSYWQAVRACHRAGVPVMVRGDSQRATQHGVLKRLAKEISHRWLLRQFDGWLYVGQRNRQYLLHYGADPQRMFFAPHSVDVPAFRHAARAADRAALRGSHGLAEGEQVILFAGKLLARKRPADLVEAAGRLRAGGRRAMLMWVGDGPERDALAVLGRQRNVPMVFLGFRNQSALAQVYRMADVLALPSDGTETWGLVVNEALACGTPCVVSDACGCAPDLVLPGTSGAVFAQGNVDALASALDHVLSQPVDAAAISALCNSYSPSATAEGIVEAARRLSVPGSSSPKALHT